jgi:succinate dehydrogenase / fumarate reductase flavoprotein subunit
MQKHAAVFRDSALLSEGKRQADAKVNKRMQDVARHRPQLIWNTDLIETLELDNLMSQAVCTMVGAKPQGKPRRPRARGFPNRDDANWMKHTVSLVRRLGRQGRQGHARLPPGPRYTR